MGQLTWYRSDEDGDDALQEFMACRKRSRFDSAFLLARVKNVLDLGSAEAEDDIVPGTEIALYEHGREAVIYAYTDVAATSASYGAETAPAGADVVVLWMGDITKLWSDSITEALRRRSIL